MIDYLFISYILGFAILFGYIIYIIIKDKKVPESISATVYSLDNKYKVMFTVMMAIVGMLITPGLFEILSGTRYAFLAFLVLIGIFGVASDPLTNNSKNIIHYTSALVLGIASQLAVFTVQPWLMTLWIPYGIYTMFMENGKWNMFFAEMIMMLSLMICGIMWK